MWKELLGAAAAAGGLCLLRSEYEKKALSVEAFCLTSGKLRTGRRLVFLSDLHSNEFGRGNERLIEAIDAVRPDAVLSGGDLMVVREGEADTRVALELLERLAARYPVFCGNGNHENRMKRRRELYGRKYEEYRDALRSAGVICLENSSAMLGEDIRITGIDLDRRFYKRRLFWRDPSMEETYLEKTAGEASRESFQILLAHSPMYFEEYAAWGADLSLSGHFHGGTVRLPLLGGLMTPQYQFFYPRCGGFFEDRDHYMLVSRGLGTHSINIRLNNRPQLAVIELRAEHR